MSKHKPADTIQDLQYFGEFGGVNPSIADSSTFTYLAGKTMEEVFEGEKEGCYLYSRHMNPSTGYLAQAIAKMENSESAQITASGMAAISSVILEICESEDEIISSQTIYGGTYALMNNFLPKFKIKTNFIDITNLSSLKSQINAKTKIIYCETMSNPLLEIADIKSIAKIAKEHNIKLVVDNTFTPLIFSPIEMGADIVIHSLTKFINGASDTVGGVVCASKEFIQKIIDVNSGASMLLGPTMDSLRANSILKNLRTLHIRMIQHSKNAKYLAQNLDKIGIDIYYPGLKKHAQHELMKKMMNLDFGFGGMLVINTKSAENAYKLISFLRYLN